VGNTTPHNMYLPDYVSPPGDTLDEKLEELGMTQKELAARTGRPLKTINEIVQGKTAITPETALQFEHVFGIPAEFWIQREQHYRESLARQVETEKLAQQVDWLDEVPIKAMVKYGWINGSKNKIEQLREVLAYFGISSPEHLDSVYQPTTFRQSTVFKSNPIAVAAWLRKGNLVAQTVKCAPFSEATFKEMLAKVRPLTREAAQVFEPSLIDLCASAGVAIAFVPELPKARISGATYWLTPSKAVIQLSLRYKTNDQLWFTFFHEAGHIILHGKKETFVEESGLDNVKEREANEFAAKILIPTHEWARIANTVMGIRMTRYPSHEEIEQWAYEIGIAAGILVGRLQHEQLVPFGHYDRLKVRLEWTKH
jgi:HTH-type transcriptional regulator / antitoxin HigA